MKERKKERKIDILAVYFGTSPYTYIFRHSPYGIQLSLVEANALPSCSGVLGTEDLPQTNCAGRVWGERFKRTQKHTP